MMMTEEFVEFLKSFPQHLWKFDVSMEVLHETSIYNYFEVVRQVVESTPLIGQYKPSDFSNAPVVSLQRASWLSYDMWRDYLRDPWFRFVLDPNDQYVLAPKGTHIISVNRKNTGSRPHSNYYQSSI